MNEFSYANNSADIGEDNNSDNNTNNSDNNTNNILDTLNLNSSHEA